jgi:hypothetical protein
MRPKSGDASKGLIMAIGVARSRKTCEEYVLDHLLRKATRMEHKNLVGVNRTVS